MLLQDQDVAETLLAYWTIMEHPEWRFGTMDSEVSLEVTLCSERAEADSAFIGSLTGVYPVMHLQGTFAAKDPVTYNTL